MQPEQLLDKLSSACAGNANAVRVTVRLVPAGGPGDKVFPPTYEGAKYAEEQRLIDGQAVATVLLDSVQSQANRLEEALLSAFDRGECRIPLLAVTVQPYGRITALQAPHRVFDAIFRDSLLDGVEYRKSDLGRRVTASTLDNATALYEICPTALIFGAWDSHGFEHGGQGNKFPRALTSEIVGLRAVAGVRTGGRLDPLGIKANAAVVYRSADGTWTLNEAEAAQEKGKPRLVGEKGRPSEIGHSNVTPTITGSGGVTIAEARQIAVLSFPQLRRLHFPDPRTQDYSQRRDVAGRTVLAALALYALALQQDSGYWLRSRCHLIAAEAPRAELIGAVADQVESFALDSGLARDTFTLACQQARDAGLSWREGLLELTPMPKLLELVARSRQLTESEE